MREPQVTFSSETFLAREQLATELGIEQELFDLPKIMKRDGVTVLPWKGLNVRSAWLEAPLTDRWTAAFRLLVHGGMPIIAEMRIFPTENLRHRPTGEWSASLKGTAATAPSGGITTSVIRNIRLGVVRTKSAEVLEKFRSLSPELMKSFNLVVSEPSQKHKHGTEKRGRPANDDLEYAQIADYYAKRWAHESRSPVADVAKRFKITKAKARSRLHEARTRHLLTTGRQGLAGGEITDKARQLLKQKTKSRKGN